MKTPYFHIPLVSGVYRDLRRRVNLIRYRGKDVDCPVCMTSWRKEKPSTNCPYCGATTRHKALVIWLKQWLAAHDGTMKTLLFAPDFGVETWLRKNDRIALTTTDYSAPGVDFHCDITNIPKEDSSYDLILCSHVMEHIIDDHAAFKELCRILRPEGRLLIQIPYARDELETDEDETVTDPVERERRWGQFDHVRRYGQDVVDRMSSAGLSCEVIPLDTWLEPDEMERFELWNDVIFVCRKT